MKLFFWNNEDGALDTAMSVILFFSISLVFSSLVISWMLLNAYGIQVSGLEFPEFQQSSQIELDSTASDEGISYVGDSWNYVEGEGRVSAGADSYILFNDAGFSNAGKHTNTYHIVNPNQQDYSIVLSQSSVRTQEVIVSPDGFHVMDGLLGFGNEVYFYPYEGANQIVKTTIKTEFDLTKQAQELEGTGTVLKFYMDGNLVFDVPSNVEMGMQLEPILDAYYGGVGSKDNIGLTLQGFGTADNTKMAGITEFLESVQIWGATLLNLMVWNVPEEYLPWELNLLFIKSQVFAIATAFLMWARGV